MPSRTDGGASGNGDDATVDVLAQRRSSGDGKLYKSCYLLMFCYYIQGSVMCNHGGLSQSKYLLLLKVSITFFSHVYLTLQCIIIDSVTLIASKQQEILERVKATDVRLSHMETVINRSFRELKVLIETQEKKSYTIRNSPYEVGQLLCI